MDGQPFELPGIETEYSLDWLSNARHGQTNLTGPVFLRFRDVFNCSGVSAISDVHRVPFSGFMIPKVVQRR